MKSICQMGLSGLCMSLLLAMPAQAKDVLITGKQSLVCATQYVVACVDGSVCTQGVASTYDIGAIFFVDAKKKQIRAAEKENGSILVSKVMQSDVTDKSFILQGFENHNGWSMGIDRIDGSYTLSLTGADVNFTVMGACTTL